MVLGIYPIFRDCKTSGTGDTLSMLPGSTGDNPLFSVIHTMILIQNMQYFRCDLNRYEVPHMILSTGKVLAISSIRTEVSL